MTGDNADADAEPVRGDGVDGPAAEAPSDLEVIVAALRDLPPEPVEPAVRERLLAAFRSWRDGRTA